MIEFRSQSAGRTAHFTNHVTSSLSFNMRSSSILSFSRTAPSLSASNYQLTLALIKPTVAAYQPDVSSILKELKSTPLDIVRTKRLFWTIDEARTFYKEHEGKFYYQRLLAGMTSGPSLALALGGQDAIKHWRAMLGPTKAYKAKWEEPSGLRARYGLGDTRNGFHGSDSEDSAARELGLVFEGWDTTWWLAQRAKGELD